MQDNDIEIDVQDILNDLYHELSLKTQEVTIFRAKEKAYIKRINELKTQLSSPVLESDVSDYDC